MSVEAIRERIGAAIAPSLVEKRNTALRMANTDALTGLSNRAAFDLARPAAEAEKLSFVVFDLNNFGKVNKLFNHSFGDNLLKTYAAVIYTVAYHYKARAFRLGGDEFVIIVSSKWAGTIRDKVEAKAPVYDFKEFQVSLSGMVGATVEKADGSILQYRKKIMKQHIAEKSVNYLI